MQGFDIVLKAMGLDPVKLVEQAEQTMKPVLDKLNQALQEFEQRQTARFDKIEEAIKALDPNFVPEGFKEGVFQVDSALVEPPVANVDTPEGGPVDNEALDPEKLAAMQPIAENVSEPVKGEDHAPD